MGEVKRFHFDSVCGDTGLIDEEAELKWWITNVCSVTDLKDNWISACDKLNELASENEELNQKNDLLTLQLDCHKHPLLKENRELVSDLNHQLEVSKALRDVVKELEKENERLKEMNDGLKQHMLQYQKLWTQMSFYFDDNIKSFNDLDHKDFKALKRLARGTYDD